MQLRYTYDLRGNVVEVNDANTPTDPGEPGYEPPYWKLLTSNQGRRINRERMGDGLEVERSYESPLLGGRGYPTSMSAGPLGNMAGQWSFGYDGLGRRSSMARGQ